MNQSKKKVAVTRRITKEKNSIKSPVEEEEEGEEKGEEEGERKRMMQSRGSTSERDEVKKKKAERKEHSVRTLLYIHRTFIRWT